MYWYLMLLDSCFKYPIKIGVNLPISVNLFRNLCVCDKYRNPVNIIRSSVQYAPPTLGLKMVKKSLLGCIIRIKKIDQTVILSINKAVILCMHAQLHRGNTLPEIRKTQYFLRYRFIVTNTSR